MKKLLYILALVSVLSSCNEYQKALKSDDIATKFKLGQELYEAGKYNKANRLFEQIVPQYRGKPQAEKLMYMNAKCHYETRDYNVAAYQFNRFATSYPKSEKAEEAGFLSAKSSYMLSPVYKKSQVDTKEALEKLQAFINLYPNSTYLSEANALVSELDEKLQVKAFEIAKQYNTTARISDDLKGCIKSMDNFLIDFPGTKLREDAMYWRINSAYKLAVRSVERKKEERIKTALSYISEFNKKYSDSKFNSDIEDFKEELQEELQQYSTKS